jgi:hypothetical protein
MRLDNLNNAEYVKILESATELKRNKKYMPAEFVEAYIGLFTAYTGFYGRRIGGSLTVVNPHIVTFNESQDVTLIIEGRVELKSVPVNTGTGNIDYTGFGFLIVDDVVIYDGRGGNSGGDGVQTVTGDMVDNTDPLNPVLSFPTASEVGAVSSNIYTANGELSGVRSLTGNQGRGFTKTYFDTDISTFNFALQIEELDDSYSVQLSRGNGTGATTSLERFSIDGSGINYFNSLGKAIGYTSSGSYSNVNWNDVSDENKIPSIQQVKDNTVSDIVNGSPNVSITNGPSNEKIISVIQTTAGLLQNVYFTGQTEVTSEGTFGVTLISEKGNVGANNQTIVLASNETKSFDLDFLGNPSPIDTNILAGDYTAFPIMQVSTNQNNQRFKIETYLCDGEGVPTGAGDGPVGTLGVNTILIADSGIVDLQANNPTGVPCSGNVPTPIPFLAGQRFRYVIVVERVGSGSNSKTVTFFCGNNYNSYFQIPGNSIISGFDSNAFHTNIAGEINNLPAKLTPVATDFVVIEDSADDFKKKKVEVINFLGGNGIPTIGSSTDLGLVTWDGTTGSAVRSNSIKVSDLLKSTTTGEPTGATVIGNAVTISQADYDLATLQGTLVPTTIYNIIEA